MTSLFLTIIFFSPRLFSMELERVVLASVSSDLSSLSYLLIPKAPFDLKDITEVDYCHVKSNRYQSYL